MKVMAAIDSDGDEGQNECVLGQSLPSLPFGQRISRSSFTAAPSVLAPPPLYATQFDVARQMSPK